MTTRKAPEAAMPTPLCTRPFQRLVPAVAIFAAFAAFAAVAAAQVNTGRIVGTVQDPSKAAIPQATVVVTDTATNQSTTVLTSERGDFVVTPLNPGAYQVTVKMDGFQTAVVETAEVQVGQSTRVDVELTLGALTESTVVTSATPLLDTESGTLGHVVTNTQIVNLPLNGRSFYELARLTPGAVLLPGGGNLLRIRANYISGTAVSGVRGSQTTFMLDGVDVTDHHQGGSLIQTSVDALQEFKVQQSAYSAEFSQAGGALNATTKSGSNQFHGALFEFMRDDRFDARNFFARETEELKRHQFGGTIGGPMLRNRTFFFASYEGMRERQGLVFNNVVPTTAMKGGDFSGSSRVIYDPLTRQPFPGNVIPASRLSPQALYFAGFVPDPNTAGGTFAHAPVRELNSDQVTVRVDQQVSSAHRIFGRYSWHDQRMDDPNAYPALGAAPLRTRGQNVVLSMTNTLSANLLHETRFSYVPLVVDLEAFLQGDEQYSRAGVRGFEETARPGIGGSFPDFAWSGYTAMNGSAFDQRPKTQDLKVWEVTDNVTWIAGRHIAKIGGKYRRWVPLFTDSKQFAGQWNFDGSITANPASPAGTGDAFADFLLGYPRQVTRAFPADTFGGQANYWHAYMQDDFKVSNRLTLNVGLRYEYSPWLSGYRGQVGTFDPSSSRPIIVAGEGDQVDLAAQFAGDSAYALFQNYIQTSSQAGLPLSITKTDRAQFGPRFGFAWRPFGETTVVRGGYGLFYEQETSTDRVNNNMVPFRLDQTAFNDQSPPVRTMADFYLGTRLTNSAAPSIGASETEQKMGRDHHFSFGVQQEIAPFTVLEVNYVGNIGRFLNGTTTNINIPEPGPGGIQARRPYPLFGGINFFDDSMNNTYHSLQTSVEQRSHSGLWYLASYTWSKSMTTQNVPAVGGNSGREKALSTFDVPHNVAISVGYELPIGQGRRLLSNANGLVDGLLGGWQVQGIYIWRSGRPFTPTISTDRANTGVANQRPNRLGSGRLDEPTVEAWFDKTAFAVPAQFTYGDSGGSILREDSYKTLDFSLFKTFRIGDQRLQFRAEAFNLTNTPSFDAPQNTTIDTAAGGRITRTSSTPRQMQFALKYEF
jgi:Carboxypeptidase regulatory-like domain/TonB dependent receptor